ncbi:uncharacterized protein JN550_013111 [Neoarthrinium moseri]|uniref:uncharacterized protein n=1 Tax=Neoarthrinium moseri TaxID=1658444 RepID=UPI001FDC3201|nr:uncharacterized protein JN550_013111 [Neoarthrinium moseri]KAI1857599.1 hypothetical protein JN550_013111 [Neoarthrinium moseri]
MAESPAATVTTPEQLKNQLVSSYVETWRANGVRVTMQEMLFEACQVGSTSNGDARRSEVFYLALIPDDGYLRVCCDDAAPVDPKLRALHGDSMAMLGDPAVVSAITPLLDENIRKIDLIAWLGPKPLEDMTTKEKVYYLAKHDLQFPSKPREPEIEVCLLTYDHHNKMTYKCHHTAEPKSLEDLHAWLDSLVDPLHPASWGHNVHGVSMSPADGGINQFMDFLGQDDEGQDEQDRKWLYKKLSKSLKKLTDTSEWRALETEDEFQQLVKDHAKNPDEIPAFIQVCSLSP